MNPTIKVQRQEKCQVAELMGVPKRTSEVNYARKNYESLRKQQEENKRRKDDEILNPPKEPFKLKRFQKVTSVVYKDPDEVKATKKPRAPPPPEPGPKIVTYDAEFAPPEPVPQPKGKNYVRDNAVQAIETAAPKPAPKQVSDAKALNPSYGKVPHYLEEFKHQHEVQREQRRLAEEAANCPPGMRLLPEAERLETLEMLEKGKDEVYQAINRLPIASNTGAVQRRRQEYENKLNEIETAIKTFSRRKVYVSIN